ncbi:MAG TPA: arginase family protein [Pseudonocardiaceae bacterium]|jgi:arginase|nr:arginase family protein [Pseudonocardiaceae bacterium]
MPIIQVPYHLDEHLPELNLPAAGREPAVLTAPLPDAGPWQRLAALYRPVAEAVRAVAADGQRPEVISGDCTVSLGVLAGLQAAGIDAGVVWFDAHGDVQTLETTTTGYIGGMPLRILSGYRPELIAEPIGLRAILQDRLLLVDARDLDPAEIDFLTGSDIRRSTVDDINADSLPAGPLVLHIDLDVIDPEELSGMRVPAPGGPSAAAVLAAARRVLDSGRVCALDLACTWLPGNDHNELRTEVISGLLA